MGGAIPLRPRVEAAVVRCADLVVASTHDEHEQLVRHYGADPDRIEIVTPGVDHEVFHPGDRRTARRALGLGDVPVALFVGRLQPLKGADLAVRALAEVSDPRTRLVVVGGPSGPDGESEVASLHALVDELGLASRIQFVAPRPHAQLADYYRAADVCVSIPDSDSSPRSVWEAMACGCPCVLSDLPWVHELIEDGRHALVVAPEPDAVAAAIRRLLTEPDLAARIAGEARELVLAHRDQRVEMDRLSELYRSVAAREAS